jgi:hypothetical protein
MKTEVSMLEIQNADLKGAAEEVREKLRQAVEAA